LKWIRVIPFHQMLMKNAFAIAEQDLDECSSSIENLITKLKECNVSLSVNLDATLIPLYDRLKTAFEELSKSSKKWDITASVAVDQKRERSIASRNVTRRLADLKAGQLDFVAFDSKAMQFTNANGGDLYLYPAFLLVFQSFQDFALVDILDFSIEYADSRFQEVEGIPNDSVVVDYTWKYANKNGSPDRRFSNNFQIPVALYGRLEVKSESGLNEEYMFRNAAATRAFAEAFAAFKEMIRTAGSTRVN
jgi:hypothetical protein